jgi:hypothetical protein
MQFTYVMRATRSSTSRTFEAVRIKSSTLFSGFFKLRKTYSKIRHLSTLTWNWSWLWHTRTYNFLSYHPMLWRDSISRPLAPVSSVEGGDDTTRPRRQANTYIGSNICDQTDILFIPLKRHMYIDIHALPICPCMGNMPTCTGRDVHGSHCKK